MREHLVGYLLDALDPAERQQVESQLTRDPRLQQELEKVSLLLTPLQADREAGDCPHDLAARTCHFVTVQTRASLAPAPATSRWTWADLAVAAGIFIAASMLFVPAINQSRFAARLAGCQNNLRQIGMALTNYSAVNRGYFPTVSGDKRGSAAGMYAVKLVEDGYLNDPHVLVCPASNLADHLSDFQVPSSQQLLDMPDAEVSRSHGTMGGSYGYSLGYRSDGAYRGPKNLNRNTFAIVADRPGVAPPYATPNHNGHGQNVLFEDAHVQYLTSCKARGCTDDIFVNDAGEVAPGLHVHDAVIGASEVQPLRLPLKK